MFNEIVYIIPNFEQDFLSLESHISFVPNNHRQTFTV